MFVTFYGILIGRVLLLQFVVKRKFLLLEASILNSIWKKALVTKQQFYRNTITNKSWNITNVYFHTLIYFLSKEKRKLMVTMYLNWIQCNRFESILFHMWKHHNCWLTNSDDSISYSIYAALLTSAGWSGVFWSQIMIQWIREGNWVEVTYLANSLFKLLVCPNYPPSKLTPSHSPEKKIIIMH